MLPTPAEVTAEKDLTAVRNDETAANEEQPSTSTAAVNCLSAATQSPSATNSKALQNSNISFYDSCLLTPPDLPSDEELSCYNPNQPRYCICNQISYGAMIACDSKACPYEWFHFPCVGVVRPPKGKWFCPLCTASMRQSSGRKRKFPSSTSTH